ncbi:MAG: DNA translocase FtsK [Candidatus Acididesulfobacter guangdongensis]|uniref:DNA translocase FtsK n=1 Tax=Acididesulfobacter guangdongensis TaxID=2597225 RepID=A0A519BIQ4_ACIG2|nr:MAG: DNA translocase FtsK [Candidatus Acididesulfobacter guangdongensis]
MQHYKKFLSSVVLILLSVYSFISLLSYNVYQISSNSYSIAVKRSVNLGGEFGSFISMWMLQIFGYGYFLLILICFIIGIILIITKKDYKFYSGLALFYLNSLIFLNLIYADSLYHKFSISGGGLIGEELLNSGERLLGEIGVILVILFVYVIAFLLLFDNYDLKKLYAAVINYKNQLQSKIYAILKIKSKGLENENIAVNDNKFPIRKSFQNNLKGRLYNIFDNVMTKLKIKKKLKTINKNNDNNNYSDDLKYSGEFELSTKNNKGNNLWYDSNLKNTYDDEKKYGRPDDETVERFKDIDKTETDEDNYQTKKYILKHEENIDIKEDGANYKIDNNKNIESRIDKRADETKSENADGNLPDAAADKEFEIPLPSILPIRVLDEKQKIDKIELTQNAKIIEKKLSDLGIKGRITGIEPGPIITMYEFEPESGVKVGKIQTVSEDLTMALKSKSVRITGVIQGKSAVGIEVPNRKRETVYFSELINSAEFKNSKSLLTIVLGKGPKGNNAVFDLAKCPHLLVAGSTGSGKSVFLNTLITSILFKATYEEVNFLMIDPKRLELTFYEGLPHLVTDVVCDPKKAAAALSWAVKEMEDRYKMMQEAKVRNIEQYNVYLKQNHKQILPFLVIIIDELSDLMLVSPKDVETSIMRLSQMARACGIHLVIATQRPSVNVITGVIKANMPSRLAFLVSSKIDSRTILDSNGAEELLGNGDMLFLPPGQGKLLRIHGAYISEEEIQNVINSIVSRHLPSQKKELLINEFEKSNNFDRITENTQDENLHEELLDLINERNMEYVSISFVQRNFRIGFNRAARLIERLQSEGILNNKGRIIK